MFIRKLFIFILLINSAAAYSEDQAYRLSPDIKPLFQQIYLKVDPDQAEFSGETTILVDVTKATKSIGFYQIDLHVNSITLMDGEQQRPLTIQSMAYDIQQAFAEEIILPKQYKLKIAFTGKINTKSDGMYLSKFEERNYIFTQFEDMHARRAFPSFDEPSNKIPYQLTIEAPQKHTVVSNTPVEYRTVNDGWQTVVFDKTKPMPSYLVAFAVGELDYAEIKGLSVPGRIYTAKGQSGRTKFIVKHTPEILHALEQYFDIEYPYQKLDFVAVPNFTHGAMENAGLVTFRSSLLLLDDEPSLVDRSRPLMVVAHELAHMWYGNLVTMEWWDDLWLNEAFASWMASKVMMDLYPEHNYKARLVQERAFGEDANPTTKPIKKEVKSQFDVMDGLGLNYSKGESILTLVESLVGKVAFQKGVQKYMQDNAWANTEADDLWSVLSEFAEFDVPAMMKTYLEQPSYPLISINADGKITQERYALAGVNVNEQQWVVPISILYKKNSEVKKLSLFLNQKSVVVDELADVEWVFPNKDATAYMRWQTPEPQLNALLKDLPELTGKEQKTLLYNSAALLDSGDMDLNQYMIVLNALAEVDDPLVLRAVVSDLEDLIYLVNESNESGFGEFLEDKLAHLFTRYGVTNSENDSNDVIRLRQSVFNILGLYSDNANVKKKSNELADKYLTDPNSVSRSFGTRALSIVAKSGPSSGFERYKKAYLATSDANVQSAIAAAMLFPQDENVIKLLDFALTEHVGAANTISFLRVASESQVKQDVLYKWLENNIEAVTKKMPAFHITRLPEYISSSCYQDNIKLSKSFYKTRMKDYEGMERSYQVALSEATQCVELKARYQKDFSNYLINRQKLEDGE